MKRWTVLFIAILLGLSQANAKTAKKRTTRSRTAPQATFDPAAANDPNVSKNPAATMAALLRAQVLLDRAKISPGEIDARPGPNLDRAVSGFQESRGLPLSGKLDEATWQALNADSVPVVAPYRLTDTDVAGPFTPIPKDLVEQSKLPALGYSSPEEAIGEQFHVSPALLRKMNPSAQFTAGTEIQVPNVLTNDTPVKAARIVVSKAGWIRALDAEGKVLAQFPCSSGSEHDPLPLGEWKVNGVAKNPPFHYNPELFWDANPTHTKAKIPPGPNNPVGVVWIDLSKEHYGIHGTPEPGNVGHTQSHGCIRLTNWDAMKLAAMVAPKMPASLTE